MVEKSYNVTNQAYKRRAVIVLGMHRSGTSAMAGMLVKLGAAAPNNLIPPNKGNARGYWESKVFKRFHNNILESAGTTWHDWRIFDPQWFDSPRAGAYSVEWEKLFLQEFGDSNLFVIKDPRICRFVPFWLKELNRLMIEPKVVLIYRNPLEVASSLRKRNGFSSDYSLLLWLRHVLDAETATRGIRRSFVKYSELLADWRRVAEKLSRELDIEWPAWSETQGNDIDNFISAELHINEVLDATVFESRDVFDWVKSTYHVLNSYISDDLSEEDFINEIDRIKSEFEKASAVFGSIVSEIEYKFTRITEELEENKKALEELRWRYGHEEICKTVSNDLRILMGWLNQLDRYTGIFFKSGRWKIVSMIGWTALVLRGRKRKLPSAEAIERIIARYRKWEPSGNEKADLKQLSKWIRKLQKNYQALMKSKSWAIGIKFVTAINRVLLRKQTKFVTKKIKKVFKEFNRWQGETKGEKQAQLTIESYICNSMLNNEFLKTPFDRKSYRILGYMDYLKKKLTERYSNCDQNELVSIIMPAYNRADIIYNAISSILSQSYKHWELIVVDDHSKDNTIEVVNAVNDPRIKLLHRIANGGISKARNDGLKASKGKWIAYLDTDDLWDPDYLLIMVNQLKENPDFKMAYSAQYVWNEMPGSKNGEINLYQEEEKLKLIRFGPFNRSLLENHNIIDVNCFIHERTLFEKYGGWPEDMYRFFDWHLLLRYTSEHFPLAVPALLSHHSEAERDDRVSILVDKEHAFNRINELLYSNNILDHFGAERMLKYGAYELLNKVGHSDYSRHATIIIPSYEALEYLRLCIKSVVEFSTDYEIVVVDNGSSPEVKNYLCKLEEEGRIKLILNNDNLGFTHAVNQGIKMSNPDNDIVLLNNDALVTRGWLEALREVMVNIGDAGLAVPRQVLLPEDSRMNAHLPKINAEREADVNLSMLQDNIVNPLFDQIHGYVEVDFAPFFCVYIKRETIDKAGLLDEIYGPHYISDRIYCDIVRNMYGKRIIYTPFSKVYHFFQQATKELKNNDPGLYKVMCKMNKWELINSKIQK